MSGSAKLEGELAESALFYLKYVTDVLDSYNIAYWLESGTLLGVAREGRLLPWDSDLDISIKSTDAYKLKRCARQLWLRGLRIRTEKFLEPCGPAKSGDLRIVKIRNRKRIFSRGDVLLDIFVKYADDDFYHWSVGKDSVVNKKVPRHFYDNLSTLEFDGKQYPVPADLDGYLTCRYGDWNTPVKEWNYLTDDQAAVNKIL